ncbi:MAG: acyl-CoA dehydrogenase family protein [Sphingomonadales bacterium]
MDLDFTEAERAFQREVRDFVTTELPASIGRKVELGLPLEKGDYVVWQKILHERGWIAPAWPTVHGGTGWSPAQQYIFQMEMALGNAPAVIPFGVNMVGPVIYTFGTDEQKKKYLPDILASNCWWCQGYSEPNAGSDLASLKMSAVRQGDRYVCNGAKIWTTMAHWADMIFCLVRTGGGARKQEGISFLLIDMSTPGITIEPIITIDGLHHVNQVFFDDVEVPVENLVGEEDKGWTYAKFLLAHERTNIADVGSKKRLLRRLKRFASDTGAGGESLIDDSNLRRRLSELEIEVMALEFTELRYLSEWSRGRPPGVESSLLKVRGTELQQAIGELFVEILGPDALPYMPEALLPGWNEPEIGPSEALPAVSAYLYGRAASIYGGSNEIQRGVLAKMVLGL